MPSRSAACPQVGRNLHNADRISFLEISRDRPQLDLRPHPAYSRYPPLALRGCIFKPILFGSKRVARVEDSVPHKLEEAAMKFVSAALGNDIDDARSVKSVLCGYGAGLDLEFLERIGKRQRQSLVAVGIVMDAAIEQERHAIVASPAN